MTHPRRPARRTGQALVETALGLLVFLVAFMTVVNVAWIMYHQVAVTQAAKVTARRAGTNLLGRPEITDLFFRSVGPTLVSSTDGATAVQITTVALDPIYASLRSPGGQPSVTVEVAYQHPVIADLTGLLPTITLRATARSRISTWSQQPLTSF